MDITKIKEMAGKLEHDWIILDAIENCDNLTTDKENTILDAIEKIKHIEATCTPEEITGNNLLTDIF